MSGITGRRGVKFSEQSFAAEVITDLIERQWDIYQEVQAFSYGPVADIVATQGRLTWVIECKGSMSLRLICQAEYWLRYANFVSVAAPASNRDRDGVMRILRLLGIGYFRPGAWNIATPRLNRSIDPSLRNALKEGHKTFAKAGNPDGSRWSPFGQTAYEVQQCVAANPGITLKELIEKVKTHYQSDVTARACIKKWIEAGVIKHITMKQEGKAVKLFHEHFLETR